MHDLAGIKRYKTIKLDFFLIFQHNLLKDLKNKSRDYVKYVKNLLIFEILKKIFRLKNFDHYLATTKK